MEGDSSNFFAVELRIGNTGTHSLAIQISDTGLLKKRFHRKAQGLLRDRGLVAPTGDPCARRPRHHVSLDPSRVSGMERKEDANGRPVFSRLGVTLNANLAAVSFDKIFCNE
jgi:hypothetical protein